MPQICDMGPTALLPLRRKACWRFFHTFKQIKPTPTNLTDDFHGSPQSLQANAGILHQIRPRPLPSRSFTTHYLFSNKPNQPDESISQIYCSSFKYSSTCFGHPHAHHQEPINCSSRLRLVGVGLLYLNVWWCTDLQPLNSLFIICTVKLIKLLN